MSLIWLLLPGLFAQELVNRTNDPSDAPTPSAEAEAAKALAELGEPVEAARQRGVVREQDRHADVQERAVAALDAELIRREVTRRRPRRASR